MKSSKSIERLFQESFNDFQPSPSPKVWNGIEEKLVGKKQRRKGLPFWWQVASVAAIFLIFSAIGAFYYNPIKTQDSISSQANSKFKSPSNSLEVIPAQYKFSSVNENLSSFENSIKSSLVYQITDLEAMSSETINSAAKFGQMDIVAGSDKTGLADETEGSEKSISTVNRLNRFLINPSSNNTIITSLFNRDEGFNDKKKSLFAAIEDDNILATEKDKLLTNPWTIQPNAAPVFMNSFNGGNPIEPSLQGKTSSNPNVSYGINVSYAINKKIKIRTGVNQVALGYNTQDVILSVTSSSFRAGSSNNLNLGTNLIGNVSLVSATNNVNVQSRANTNSLGISPSKFNSVGTISHDLGFVEVPFEIEYALVDKKIGVHVLGGASTYLLNNNEIFFEENGRSSSIGNAENLNTFSFSANLGVGMDYNFSERVSFNLEPKFLYQINTFQSNTDSFQPYFFGIYSGIKFKF